MRPQDLIKALQGRIKEGAQTLDQSPIGALNPVNFQPKQLGTRIHDRATFFAQHPENINFTGEMQAINPGGFAGALAPHTIGGFSANPNFANAIPDNRGQNQLLIEEALKRGDVGRATQLANQLSDPATRDGMINVINMNRQTAPFTEALPGVFRPAQPTQTAPVQVQMPKLMRTPSGGFTILKSMAK